MIWTILSGWSRCKEWPPSSSTKRAAGTMPRTARRSAPTRAEAPPAPSTCGRPPRARDVHRSDQGGADPSSARRAALWRSAPCLWFESGHGALDVCVVPAGVGKAYVLPDRRPVGRHGQRRPRHRRRPGRRHRRPSREAPRARGPEPGRAGGRRRRGRLWRPGCGRPAQ